MLLDEIDGESFKIVLKGFDVDSMGKLYRIVETLQRSTGGRDYLVLLADSFSYGTARAFDVKTSLNFAQNMASIEQKSLLDFLLLLSDSRAICWLHISMCLSCCDRTCL